MIKNLLIVLAFIFTVFLAGEVTLRCINYSLPADILINYESEQFKNYSLNPSSGDINSAYNAKIQYHFYYPHLRDTSINKDAKHILVLGDEFTFGWALPWDETYIHYFQIESDKKFGKNYYQFLNAATPNWGATDELAYLEQFGSYISPEYVLIFINTNDIGKSLWKNMDATKLPEKSIILINKRPTRMLFLSIIYNNFLYHHSRLLHFLHDHASHFYNHYYVNNKIKIANSSELNFEDNVALDYAEQLFIKINNWCQAHHAKLIIVTTGFNAFYPEIHDPTKIFLQNADAFFRTQHIPYYDLADNFKKIGGNEELQMYASIYPNSTGAITIGKFAWPWLAANLELSNSRTTMTEMMQH